jgi:hypothetical protein
MRSESMKISPRYTVEHWKVLTFSTEEEWQKAIEIFEDRIRRRFLEPVARIEKYEYAGFATLALDCLLIETLQQFREGKAQTPRGKSKEYFVRFLTETSFSEWFTNEMAKMFYKQIRCGILHQAEVEGSSRVLIRENIPLASLTEDSRGLVINRKLFHQELVQEFETYTSKLRDPSEQELRAKFKKKMDYICRLSEKAN